VVASLAGPNGAEITLASGTVPAGVHALGWAGTEQGSPEPEGKWTFTVTGTDDRSVTTSAQRQFSLDDTLSSLVLTSGSHGLPTATFKLTRGATVTVQIQRPNGISVATIRSGQQPAGPEQVTWSGKIGRHRAAGGRYQLVVQATSSVGTSSLAAPFSLPSHKRK
jgi:flagellar hook assembly protein FlgD